MSQFFILRTRLRNQIDTVFLETIGIVILRAITVIVQIDEEEVEINEIVSYIYIYNLLNLLHPTPISRNI